MPIGSKINPGRLDTLLTFESHSISTNSIGESIDVWNTYRQMYGTISWGTSLGHNGPERFEAKELVGGDSVKVIVRHDSGLNTLMRFKMNSETSFFYIKDVQNWPRERYSIVIAERRDNQ